MMCQIFLHAPLWQILMQIQNCTYLYEKRKCDWVRIIKLDYELRSKPFELRKLHIITELASSRSGQQNSVHACRTFTARHRSPSQIPSCRGWYRPACIEPMALKRSFVYLGGACLSTVSIRELFGSIVLILLMQGLFTRFKRLDNCSCIWHTRCNSKSVEYEYAGTMPAFYIAGWLEPNERYLDSYKIYVNQFCNAVLTTEAFCETLKSINTLVSTVWGQVDAKVTT